MGLTDEQYRKVMRKGWNLTPSLYDRLWTPVFREYAAGCLARAGVGRGKRVLDVATGPGTAALMAAEAVGADGSVVGVDISDRFVEVANEKAAAAGMRNVRFERHAMETMELPSRSFDAVTCVFGLMYGAPVDNALERIRDVLAPGGKLGACVWGRRERNGFREMFPILGERLQMDVCPLFFALGVPGAGVRALGAAGFVDAREERVETTLHWKDETEACVAVFDGGAGALPFSMFSDEIRAAVRAEFVASIEPYRRGAGFAVPAEFVYLTATCST